MNDVFTIHSLRADFLCRTRVEPCTMRPIADKAARAKLRLSQTNVYNFFTAA